MSGVAYIRFYADDWLSGTQELSLEERGALATIVALTAATGNPPVADYDRLSRRFGCTKAKAKKVISALEEMGKITLEDGAIHNTRAKIETKNAQEFRKKQSENARGNSSNLEEKPNKNNADDQATAKPRHKPNTSQPVTNNHNTSSLRSDVTRAYQIFIDAIEGSGIPKPRALNDDRKRKIKARLSEHGLDVWEEACGKLVQSDFCTGKVKEFVADLDFMLQPSSFQRLIEGKYDNRLPRGQSPPPKDDFDEQWKRHAEAGTLDELLATIN